VRKNNSHHPKFLPFVDVKKTLISIKKREEFLKSRFIFTLIWWILWQCIFSTICLCSQLVYFFNPWVDLHISSSSSLVLKYQSVNYLVFNFFKLRCWKYSSSRKSWGQNASLYNQLLVFLLIDYIVGNKISDFLSLKLIWYSR
jgi:hypothetical protein